ncbi:alpha/beta hydrolase [Rothia nasimurium]|uniref:alpha/beta hydrolase n=1 Tax=Rothia nasimurium TaxID=85336 RepID=UPI0014316C0A|nr:alpha/beta hydrolase [Rothia nasimurium]MBF0809236.1 alpha/beta hydrolase [Rothia nasimurium]
MPRDGKTPVSLNLYQPAQADPGQVRPLIINVHGGGFVYGDADVLDTQSQRLADSWGATVLAIDYTKADVQPVEYGVEEIADVVRYAQENSDYFAIDPNNTHLMGTAQGPSTLPQQPKNSSKRVLPLLPRYSSCLGPTG